MVKKTTTTKKAAAEEADEAPAKENKRKGWTKVVTPIGTFKYPWLNKADTKFDSDGEYKVSLVLPAKSKEAKDLMKLIDAEVEKAVETAKADPKNKKSAKQITETESRPYKMEVDEDGDETGNVEFLCKRKAKYKKKDSDKLFKREIPLWDSAGQRLDPEDTSVWGGSEGRVKINLRHWYFPKDKEAGVGLDIVEVQITKLVQGEGGASGFEEVEGGFKSSGSKGKKKSDDNDDDGEETGDGEEQSDAEDGEDF